jgi:hypothetical protein
MWCCPWTPDHSRRSYHPRSGGLMEDGQSASSKCPAPHGLRTAGWRRRRPVTDCPGKPSDGIGIGSRRSVVGVSHRRTPPLEWQPLWWRRSHGEFSEEGVSLEYHGCRAAAACRFQGFQLWFTEISLGRSPSEGALRGDSRSPIPFKAAMPCGRAISVGSS